MNVSKISIKLGSIEVEFEGSETFLKDELPELLTAVAKLYRDAGLSDEARAVKIKEPSPSSLSSSATSLSSEEFGTVSSIAAKLGCSSGPDLILAALLRMVRAGNMQVARKALTEEMKAATGFYKTTYTSNLTSSLTSLIKTDAVREVAKGIYTLSVKKREELESKLAAGA